MIRSQTIKYKDFNSSWYRHWAQELKQNKRFTNEPIHNKFWQNAAIIQSIYERGLLIAGKKALGFGVGNERVPSLLAKYGVKVTATDQNPELEKAQGWDNGQLAHNLNSLNNYKICDKKKFKDHVSYEINDMNNIKKKFHNKYDIVWSNCALGHLGSIENGLSFIENSLECLKPGGLAVHTTEVNVLSNIDTLDKGGTVIFRYQDISNLFTRLKKRGYKCSPLVLSFGTDNLDKLISFEPFNGDNLLKIQVQGHVLSQIILIISKPYTSRDITFSDLINIKIIFWRFQNFIRKQLFIGLNPWLRKYIALNKVAPECIQGISPIKAVINISGVPGSKVKVPIKYKNHTGLVFFGLNHALYNTKSLLLATNDPINKHSMFADSSWFSPNRPCADFSKLDNYSINGNSSGNIGAFIPGKFCTYEVILNLPKKPGEYTESFCLVLEGEGAMPKTNIKINIKVT